MQFVANHYPSDREEPHIKEWLRGKIIGEPQVAPGCDRMVAHLKRLGMVGVYAPESTDEKGKSDE